MKRESVRQERINKIKYYGGDILKSKNMQSGKRVAHHGSVTVYDHTVRVAYYSLALAEPLAKRFHVEVNERSLIRGALLHDYYLYNWHVRERWHRLHGFRHPFTAFKNASEEYDLDAIQKDIIRKHMFPMTLIPPRYRESLIVCLADKLCAARDFAVDFADRMPQLRLRRRYQTLAVTPPERSDRPWRA